MRHSKLAATLAALTLTIGGLALAGPAFAEEPSASAAPQATSTQEVASSPSTESAHEGSVPSTSPSTTEPESTSTEILSDETASLPPESPVAPVPPTEPTTSSAAPEQSVPSSISTSAAVSTSTPKGEHSTGHDPVTICHQPGTPAQQTLTVDDNALKGHLKHGDTLGECAPIVTPPTPTPVEGWWLMPNGGTADNVTWPQTATPAGTVPCGVTAQVDTYPSQAVLDQLAADGVLTQGEDYSTVISWRFVYGGDCPPRPEDVTKIIDDHETTDCDAGTITHIVTEQTTTWTWNADTEMWDAVLGEPVTTATTREADSERCPVVVVPPTEPPVVVPPVVAPPTPTVAPTAETPAALVADAPTDRLASTGSDTDLQWAIGGGAILLLIIGVGIVFGRKRKA